MGNLKDRLIAVAGGVAFVTGFLPAQPASAQLTLTPAGIADGFTLSTFATVTEPYGVAVNSAGNVLVNSRQGKLYVFPDVDGNTPSTAIYTQSSNILFGGFTYDNGTVYGAVRTVSGTPVGGNFQTYNLDGTVANSNVFPQLAGTAFMGMATNPVTGDIIANSTLGLIDINPTTGNYFVINSTIGDAVSVSPNGKTVFTEQGPINGYTDAPNGKLVFTHKWPDPDGTAMIKGGALNGDLIVNNTNGTVYLYDLNTVNTNPANSVGTLIASGGSGGDYVEPDWTNGSLFLNFTGTTGMIARLTCPNCSFGGPPPTLATSLFAPSVPEPSTWAMLLLGFAGLGFAGLYRWVKRPGRTAGSSSANVSR